MNAPMPLVIDRGTSRDRIARAVQACVASGGTHHIPLLVAASAGSLTFTPLTNRLSRPNMHRLNRAGQPALILVGDDDDAPTGPLGWAAADQVIAWARCALVHGTGADVKSYQLALVMAAETGRVLLIETSSDAAASWVEALHKVHLPAVVVLPPGESVHPEEDAA